MMAPVSAFTTHGKGHFLMDVLCAELKLILVYLFSSLPLKLYLETKLIGEVCHIPVVSVSSSKRYNLEPDNDFSFEKNAFLLR